jgi:DNA polymerase-3 subunit beta
MELKLQSKDLLQKIKVAARVINSKNALPILGDFLFETKGDVVLITASDSEQWLSLKCPVVSCDGDTRFCVSASDFLKAVDNLNDVVITLSLDEQSHTIKCDYGNGSFTMPYEDANEFPMANMDSTNAKDFIIDGKKVLKAIEKTGFATANDELRPVMNGIHFDFFADGMVCATSDGHKLARYKDKSITREDDGTVPNFTMPKKPSNILMSVLSTFEGDVKVSFNDKALCVSNADFRLSARLLDFHYPNYDAVIPKTSPITVAVDKDSLLNALKRVLPMANDSSYLVELDFSSGQVVVSAKDIDFSKSASETVTCDCDVEIKIGFKGSTLIEILRNIDDDNVVIELDNPSRAGIFFSAFELTRDEYLSLCMPMLIQ